MTATSSRIALFTPTARHARQVAASRAKEIAQDTMHRGHQAPIATLLNTASAKDAVAAAALAMNSNPAGQVDAERDRTVPLRARPAMSEYPRTPHTATGSPNWTEKSAQGDAVAIERVGEGTEAPAASVDLRVQLGEHRRHDQARQAEDERHHDDCTASGLTIGSVPSPSLSWVAHESNLSSVEVSARARFHGTPNLVRAAAGSHARGAAPLATRSLS